MTDECTEAQLGLTQIGVGESIYSGFTHNPHRLILDSVIDPKAERGSRARGDEPEGRSSEHRIASGFTHNPAHHLIARRETLDVRSSFAAATVSVTDHERDERGVHDPARRRRTRSPELSHPGRTALRTHVSRHILPSSRGIVPCHGATRLRSLFCRQL